MKGNDINGYWNNIDINEYWNMSEEEKIEFCSNRRDSLAIHKNVNNAGNNSISIYNDLKIEWVRENDEMLYNKYRLLIE